ncbi:hypothetical protein [Geodermatophilus ruber]|uniref:TrbL/VirB6 plasmid conjugal transfer protein n=1 Tax=Geodermatophilus ruber TaxID=504800 RepID=A0A1I4GBS8_9ACTN|nr:hypothetical protein [Geodermatophilus ruber]SFL26993.1 hypothetical protein SAMN04488085_108231 [Geodermatophilus ruber]
MSEPPPPASDPPPPPPTSEVLPQDGVPELTPEETAQILQDDRIAAAALPGGSGPDDPGPDDPGGSGGPDDQGGPDLGGPDLDGPITGSVDISDPDVPDLAEAFLDPAIPAAGTGVLDNSEGGNPLGDLAREIVEAAGDALAAVARLWADPPSPGIGTVGPDGVATPSEAVGLLTGSLAWYTGAMAVVAVLIAAGRMVWQQRSQPLADLLRGLGTLVLVSGAGLTGVMLLVSAADAFSVWILERATGDVEGGLTELLALQQSDDMSVVLTILLGATVLVGAVLQVVLLVARGVVLVVLAGVLPLTASATNTDTGRAVFVRTLTWLVAFALYQPAAALVYATAFLLAPAPADAPLVAALSGVTFLGLAIAALPVLLRVLRPAVRTAASAGRMRVVTGGLPTGARAVVPVTVAPGGATSGSGGASPIRVPSARAAGSRPAAVVFVRNTAQPGAVLPGIDPDTLLEAGTVPVTGPVQDGRRLRVAAPRPAADDRALPTPRTDGEDLS